MAHQLSILLTDPFSQMVGTSRCDVPARVSAGGMITHWVEHLVLSEQFILPSPADDLAFGHGGSPTQNVTARNSIVG